MQYAGLHVPTEIAFSGAKVINFLIISKLHAVFFCTKISGKTLLACNRRGNLSGLYGWS